MKQIDPMEYDYIKAASAQDCTGLIPSGIRNTSEIENYEELYPFLPFYCKDEEYWQESSEKGSA